MPTYDPILDELAALLGAEERNAQGGFLGFCPLHVDLAPSLSVNPGDGRAVMSYCHAGCPQAEVQSKLEELLQRPAPETTLHDIRPAVKVRPRRIGHCTVAALAAAKRLPLEFLEGLGLNNYEGTVIVPYRMEDGKRALRHRRRWEVCAGRGGSSWTGLRGDWLIPYGLDRLAGEGRPFCFIVEGESDCWTLWNAGFPALGIPGATMSHVLDPKHVAQFSWLIIWREPGAGGEVFVRGLTERLPGANLRVIRGEDLGVKDPSELWIRDPDVGRFKAALRKAVRS
jgi:hypothetical protein